MVSLRGKVTLICSFPLFLAILTVSLLEIGRATRLMVENLAGSGGLLVAQCFEEMRATLAAAPAADPRQALAGDSSLRALMSISQAFGKGVSYIRIEDMQGQTILSAPESAEPRVAVLPFDQLEAAVQRWWPLAPFWVLWSGRVYESAKLVEIDHQPFAVIKVGLSTDLVASEVRRTVGAISQIGAIAVLLSFAAAVALSRVLLHPVLTITSGVEQLATTGDEVHLAIERSDEFGTLAHKFNELSKRISADRRQWETERGKFFKVFRSIADAVLLLDARGSILFANAEAQGRLGLPAGGVADGKPLTLLLGKSHPLARMITTAYALGSEVHDVPIELNTDSGISRFLISISSLGQGPEPPGLLVIARDLGPIQKLENVVDYSDRLARLGALISGVAHQLRNPLNAMNLQLELLSQEAERGMPLGRRLESVRREIARLDQAMNALLRFMRPEELKLTQTSLNDLVSEVAAQTVSPPVETRFDLDPECPAVMADRGLLGEALRNIMINAVEAMPDGGTLTIRTALDANGSIDLSIRDQGHGIAADHLDQIFLLYFTTKEGGNGLGLPLAMRAIDLHHGTLEVESEAGLGTTVRIRLPVDDRCETPMWSEERGGHA